MSATLTMTRPPSEPTYRRTDDPCIWCLGQKMIWECGRDRIVDWEFPVTCPECFGLGVHFQRTDRE